MAERPWSCRSSAPTLSAVTFCPALADRRAGGPRLIATDGPAHVIWRQSSKSRRPSGSIRSSSTMSGSSVSSSCMGPDPRRRRPRCRSPLMARVGPDQVNDVGVILDDERRGGCSPASSNHRRPPSAARPAAIRLRVSRPGVAGISIGRWIRKPRALLWLLQPRWRPAVGPPRFPWLWPAPRPRAPAVGRPAPAASASNDALAISVGIPTKTIVEHADRDPRPRPATDGADAHPGCREGCGPIALSSKVDEDLLQSVMVGPTRPAGQDHRRPRSWRRPPGGRHA